MMNLLGMSPLGAAFLLFAMFIAAFIRGYSGFGFAAFSIAAASLITNPLFIAPIILLLDIMIFVLQWRSIRKQVAWRRVVTLMIGSLVGVPIGAYVLSNIGVDLVRIAIFTFILLMCVLLFSGWSLRTNTGDFSHIATGTLAGMANAAAIGGLPVAAFFASQIMPAAVFRATLFAYFGLLDLWTLPVLTSHGFVTFETLIAALICLPIVQAGAWLGSKHFLKTDPQEFRRLATMVLAIIAAMGLTKALL